MYRVHYNIIVETKNYSSHDSAHESRAPRLCQLCSRSLIESREFLKPQHPPHITKKEREADKIIKL